MKWDTSAMPLEILIAVVIFWLFESRHGKNLLRVLKELMRSIVNTRKRVIDRSGLFVSDSAQLNTLFNRESVTKLESKNDTTAFPAHDHLTESSLAPPNKSVNQNRGEPGGLTT